VVEPVVAVAAVVAGPSRVLLLRQAKAKAKAKQQLAKKKGQKCWQLKFGLLRLEMCDVV
jgi:hypothetical protein